jgi:hypothetical protein
MYIQNYHFSLRSFVIPSHLEVLELCALLGCDSLREFPFETPSHLEVLELCALLGCDSLREFLFETPSHLRQLDFPRPEFGSICIQDSVEAVSGSTLYRDDGMEIVRGGTVRPARPSRIPQFS